MIEHKYKEERSKSVKHFSIHRTPTVYLYFCWIRITVIYCQLNSVFLHNSSFLKLYHSVCQPIQIIVSLRFYICKWDQHKWCRLMDLNLRRNARASSKMRSLKISVQTTYLVPWNLGDLVFSTETFQMPKGFLVIKSIFSCNEWPNYSGLFRGYPIPPNEIMFLGNRIVKNKLTKRSKRAGNSVHDSLTQWLRLLPRRNY